MLSDKLTKALNDQVNAEYYSAYLYHSMSAYAEHAGLKGIANWLFVQAREEVAHGVHIYQYILDRGAVPSLTAIEPPPASFSGIEDIFEKVLAHEKKVTEKIGNIATLAMQENDHACYHFILRYADEQVEEEADAGDIVGKIKTIDGNKGLLLMLDKELGSRAFNNPFPKDSKLG